MEGMEMINKKETRLALFYLHLHTSVIPADAGKQKSIDCGLSGSVKSLKSS